MTHSQPEDTLSQLESTPTKILPQGGLVDDQPADKDLLNYEDYAMALAKMIMHPATKTPLTLGIYGSWGIGKTTLMKLVEKNIKSEDEGILTIWFNAWQYSQEDELWAAFLQSLLNQIKEQMNWFQWVKFSLRLLLNRIDKNKLLGQLVSYALRILIAAVPLFITFPAIQRIGDQTFNATMLTWAGGITTAALGLWVVVKPFVTSVRENITIDFSSLQKRSNFREHIAFLDDFHEHFEDIVSSLPNQPNSAQKEIEKNNRHNETQSDDKAVKKLVIFIDDLDRCPLESIIQVLDAVEVFIDVPGCVHIIGADPKMIGEAITKKYPDDKETQQKYIEKIIELEFRLPPLADTQIENYIDEMPVAFPDSKCREVFTITGLKPNPRKIKRFINTFLLLTFLAETRKGLSDAIEPVRLAKLVVIQRNHPDLYEVLSQNVKLIQELESYVLRKSNHPEEEPPLPSELEPFKNRRLLHRLLLISSDVDDDDKRFSSLSDTDIQPYFTFMLQFKSKLEDFDIFDFDELDLESGIDTEQLNIDREDLAELNERIQQDPADANALARRGNIYFEMHKYKKALADFNRAINLDPTNALALARRGEIFRKKKRFEEALLDFNKAIELNPNDAWTFARRGETYRQLRRFFQGALSDFNKAIELNPEDSWTLARRGEIFRTKKKFEEALSDFNKAIELNPGDAWTLARRGETYRQMTRFDEALSDFGKAIEINSQYAWAFARRGETYRQMGRFNEALSDLRKATAKNPGDWWSYASLGETYRQLKQFENAINMFDTAIRKRRGIYHWAIAKRGMTYRQIGNYQRALDDFNKLIGSSKSKKYYYQRSLVYLAIGQSDRARQDIASAIQLAKKRYQSGTNDWEDIFELALYYVADNRWEVAKKLYSEMFIKEVPGIFVKNALADLKDLLTIKPNNKIIKDAIALIENYLKNQDA